MTKLKESFEREFFESAFNTYYERVVVYVYRYCRDWHAAENLVQDTFIAFWENLPKVDKDRTPLPYLLFVAKNKTINYLNREIIMTKHKDNLKSKELMVTVKALENNIMNEISFKEIENIVQKSLNEMPAKTKEFFQLSRYGCKMNEEIAKMKGVSVKTVEYRIMSALRVLRKNLKDYFPEKNIKKGLIIDN